jgi:transposase InsO family protein
MDSDNDQEPRHRARNPGYVLDPREPRSQGQGINDEHPGAPRLQGQGARDENPGAPRLQGQGPSDENPRAPRLQGQGPSDGNPGAPRLQGQGPSDENPGAPRLQGQGVRYGDPEDTRSDYYNRDRSRFTGRGRESSGREQHELDDNTQRDGGHPRREYEERRGRSRRRRRSSSEDPGERYHTDSKRFRSRDHDYGSDILDKFLDILNRFKGSDKPKLTFNTNAIPEFDPMSREQTVLTWLTKVEECASIYQWDDREIIHYALPKLVGVAKTWYQGLPSVLFTWTEWKRKLIESFPCREDYAELLTEMLSKRCRYGESLDQYYYAKINLLNRCKIYGRQAVDCILYGVDDRAVKVGAQAARLSEPEQVLVYFRTVKVGSTKDRDQQDPQRTRFNDRKRVFSQLNGTKENTRSNTKCYNCNELGHRSSTCKQPAARCTHCDKLGHLAENCFRRINKKHQVTQDTKDEAKEKQVAELHVDDACSKYMMDIKVNGSTIKCHIDLGSQCSLIKLSAAQLLDLEVGLSEDLPILRGIGGNLVTPVGVVSSSVEVQGIKEDITLYVVDDYVIKQPVLLGHSFTEKPDIVITKTSKEVIFHRTTNEKVHLKVRGPVTLPCNVLTPVPIESTPPLTGTILVNGSLRGPEGKEYYLFPGQYDINHGVSTLIVLNTSPEIITLGAGSLLTRAIFKQGNNVTYDCCSVIFNEKEIDETINCGESLSNEERLKLQQLLSNYGDCFSKSLDDLGFTKITEMVIELEDTQPVVYRPYRMSYAERILVRNMVQEMLDNGIVRESSSPYASPIVLVQKKTGDKRLCVDYRALNRKTKKDHYPLPRVEDQLDQLSGNTLFTSLDLASGYYQIPIAEESRPKTAFVTPDGQYEYNRMPFGLVNAPSVFQRTINKILSDAKIKYAIVYMDDILIPAKDVAEGLQRLEEVLRLLREGGLTLKVAKCNFFQSHLDFLGFEVSAEGIRPGRRKTDAVEKFPTPSNQHEVRQFLGLSGFFRRFIKGYALIARPLTDLLQKDSVWTWDEAQKSAFDNIKTLLTHRPLLALYDPKADTQLHTDASKDGVAGILLQANAGGNFQPVSYFSRKTTPDECKLHSYELETLAVIASLNRFRVYLVGIPFQIFTDCNALRYTLTKRDVVPRVARWWIQIQEYDCTIEYRPGTRMLHADALSRNAVDEDSSGTHILDVLTSEKVDQDWITTVQSTDAEIKMIKEVLGDQSSEQVADFVNNYRLKNGRVYRVVNDELKWVVPKSVRWQIVQKNHDDVGHCGFDKTLQRIKKHYWFAKMRRFVKKYVTSCLECAHHKAPGGKREGGLHPIEKVSIPFHTIHADHLGPFIKSKKGNCYLLVIIDSFTKYANVTAVKNTKSATSIKVIKEHISYFGVPSRLITDKGTSFTSKTFKEFVSLYGIKHIENAVATPRANGQVERFNRTILNALATSSHGDDEKNWDDYVTEIQIGLNTTTHKTTQKTPSELLFGFNVTSNSQGILNSIISDTINVVSSDDLNEVREQACDKIKKQQEKDVLRFNKNRKPGTIHNEGDLVRVERQVAHEGKSQKLVNKFQGPYRIKKVLPNDRFLIEDTPLTRKHGRRYENVVALDKILPWLNFDRDLNTDTDNGSSSSDPE